jgi:membrane-associated phospholipid phosphatase
VSVARHSLSFKPAPNYLGLGDRAGREHGGIIAAVYTAVAGRAHPIHSIGADLTHDFKFGLLRGAFWGWPSSHTTIAFVMAVTVFGLFPRQPCVGCLAIIFAVYIRLGVTGLIERVIF